ncbi:MAG: DUF1801 domain-containing protein [Acidobacteria bacterium]|jgi:hypothetical protein|nr:DUF1801 domain-containing protein [Acidobacteriota bacterium]
MAEQKTKATKASVSGYIAAIANEQRRKDCKALATLITKATGLKPKMWGSAIVGFGSYHYKYDSGHEGDSCVVGFSSRAGAISLYVMNFDGRDALLTKLGKHTAAKSCLYVKSLEDVDAKVLTQVFKKGAAAIKKRYGFQA